MKHFLAALLLAAAAPAFALDPPATVLQGTAAQQGLLPVHVDAPRGPLPAAPPAPRRARILLSLPPPDAEGISGRFIYVAALETGLGSASLGLDRALSSGSRLLVFRRVGRKLVAEIENPRFRASGQGADEQQGVRHAFA